ncbi:MAG: hypothetical protein WA419_11375 [Silvibacterium sp.]
MNRLAIAASAFALLAVPYAARAQAGTATEGGQQYSSSADWKSYLTDYDFDGAPGASASPQYGQSNNRYPEYTSRWSHLAVEAGAGFTAPVGNTAHGWETYGYNVRAGAGWNFSKRLGALIEYQWNRDKIPGSTLTQLAIQSGSSVPFGGNVNTWSFTLDPIIYQPFTKTFGGYITGGGGFYRKVTNFTAPVLGLSCYYYCYEGYFPTTIAHSSSNQGGLNIGVGGYWKAFGEDSNTKLYTEVRYVWVDSPVASNSDPYGSGTQGTIPVTFGVRF